MLKLPKIYPITNKEITRLSHPEQVEILIEAGATLIQLRDKNASSEDFYNEAADAIKLAHASDVKIIINDRVDIALVLRADGVHLGQDDLSPEHARRLLGNEAIIGLSTHNVEQAKLAAKLPVDYVAIGPIFSTKTKEDHEIPVGIEVVKAVKSAVGDLPVVAIGGIDQANAAEVLSAGAMSLAVISALLSPPAEIVEKFKNFGI